MKSWTLLCPIAQNLVMPLLTVSCLFYTLWIILSQQIEFSSNLQLITFIFKAVKTADHHKWPVAKRYTVPSNSTLSRTLNIQQFVHCSRYKFLLISRTFPRTAEHLYSRLRFARVEQPQLKLLNTGWSKITYDSTSTDHVVAECARARISWKMVKIFTTLAYKRNLHGGMLC